MQRGAELPCYGQSQIDDASLGMFGGVGFSLKHLLLVSCSCHVLSSAIDMLIEQLT
jgi:hypothetical protein